MRGVVQRLGVSMTEAQPALELSAGLDKSAPHRASLSSVGLRQQPDEEAAGPATDPGFGTFSPVVVGREDARVLAHFVLLAVESNETKEIRSIYYELEATGEDLVFVPAIWDPRYIHESNWRLLLREFDGLVA